MEYLPDGDVAAAAVEREYSSRDSEEERKYEIIVFKIKRKGSVYSIAETECTVDTCLCEDASVLENVQKFCQALGTIAECRSRMCPYTLETLLINEIFNVNFKWLELGEDSSGCDSDTESSNPDDDTDNLSSIVQNGNREIFDDDQSSVGDRAGPSSTNGFTSLTPHVTTVIRSHELPDVSSTTSGDLSSTFNSNTPSEVSSSTNIIAQSTSVTATASSTSGKPKYTTSALVLYKSTVENFRNARSNPVTQEEYAPPTGTENPQRENMTLNETCEHTLNSDGNVATEANESTLENEQENASSKSATCAESMEISAEVEPSLISEVLPTISDQPTEAAAKVHSIPSSSMECVPSNSPLIPETVNNNEANEEIKENQSVGPSESGGPTLSTQPAVEASVNPSISQAQPPILSSYTESMEMEETLETEDEDEVVYESSLSIFERTGGAARIRGRIGSRQSSIASSKCASIGQPEKETEPQWQPGSGEKMEEDKVRENSDEQQKDCETTSTPQTQRSSQGTPERGKRCDDKKSDGQEMDTPTLQEEGVTTRSRSNRPAPASVKRQRADRTAKQNAQARISSTFVSSSSNESSSCTTPSTPSTTLGKRLRSSDVSHKTPSQPTTNSSTKGNTGQLETRGEEKSDLPSSSSHSTPTLHEPSNPEDVRQLRSSPAPTKKNENQETSATCSDLQKKNAAETSPVQAEVKEVDAVSSSETNDSDDESSSDSGESQISQLSQVPLKQRLEKRRRKAEKLRQKSVTQSHNFDVRTRVKLAKKRNKESLKLHPPAEESSPPKKKSFMMSNARAVLNRLRSKATDKEDDGNDGIEVIEERPVKSKSVQQKQNTKVSKANTTTTQSSKDNSSKSPPEGIRINLKQLAQRSSKSPATTAMGETAATKSSSCSYNKVTSIPKPVDIVDDLEDGNAWEFRGISSPQKAQQIHKGLVGTNIPPTDTGPNKSSSSSSNLQQSSNNSSPSKRNQSPATTPTTTDTDGGAAQSTRALRVKKAIFDPKMEAIKISPKPVPKVTKETLQQQQQQSTLNTSSSTSSISRRNSTEVTTQRPEPQTDQADIIEIITPQVPKESPASASTQAHQQEPPNPQSIPIPGICDEPIVPTLSEKSPQKSQTPQKPQNAGEKSVGQTSKPKNCTLTLVDGEIRALPKLNTNVSDSATSESGSSSTTPPGDTGPSRASGRGSWRRGDSVNFEAVPGDDEDRRRNNNWGNRRPVGGGGFRGGSNRPNRGGHQPFGNYPVEFGPMQHGWNNGPRGPRSPFRGPPPHGGRSIESEHSTRSRSRSRDHDHHQRNGHHRDYRRN